MTRIYGMDADKNFLPQRTQRNHKGHKDKVLRSSAFVMPMV